MKKAFGLILAVICMLALRVPALADAIVPLRPTIEKKSDPSLIIALVVAVVIIAVVILVTVLLRKKK